MPDPSLVERLVVLALALAVLFALVATLALLLRRRPKARIYLLVGAVCLALGAWYLATQVSPPRIFAEVFGEAPPDDVVELDYEIDREDRHGVLFMRFRASWKTVSRLIRWRNLGSDRLPAPETLVPAGLQTAPWWPPAWIEEAEVYHGVTGGPQYRHLDDWLFRAPEGDEVVYVRVGRSRPAPSVDPEGP